MDNSRDIPSQSLTPDRDRFEDWQPVSPEHKEHKQFVDPSKETPDLANLTNGVCDAHGEADDDGEADGEADLSSTSLEHLSDTALNDRLTVLTLDFNDLTSLPECIGQGAPNLRILSVNGNQLKTLPHSIGSLQRLEEIHLNENCLEFIPDSVCSLKRLRILRLTGNSVEKLPDDLGEINALQSLTIDENSLSHLPKTFGLLENLQTFESNTNKLTSLPSGFGKLKNLKILNLSNNQIERLPDNFGDLKSIEFLDVSGNQIEHLPKYFNSSQTLRKFYADCNLIGELPDWISQLPQAVEVSVKDNKLSHQAVTETFGQTNHRLKVLDMSGNFMTSLPNSIGELTELETLHLGSVIDELERRNFQNGNWISQLPVTFCQMVNLKELHLDENQIQELPEDFGNLVNLEFLDLGQNMLHELPDSFGNLRSLRICLLSKNHLQLLPSNFGQLTALVDLRMDNNMIAELPESFEKLVQLKTLDLFNNLLAHVPSCLQHFNHLVRLDIDENKLGMPRHEVPMVVRQSKYPPRDPSLKDNWRGRPRQDLTGLESSIIQVIDAGPLTGVEERQEEDSEKYSEQQLELAARRNMSIWRSHDGPTQREKFVRGESAFRNWLSRNKTFANVASEEAESEGAGSSEGDESEEEDDDDGYCISYSKNDWGSASWNEEDNWDLPSQTSADTQTETVGEEEIGGECENWDEEIGEQFSSSTDPPPVSHHPTWTEAHQPTKDLQTLFFAFDLHTPSIPRNTSAVTFPEEPGQYDDAD
ncbi:leucine-rich repeat protein SHOC-2-like [Haliotis rufescens]|uniref:leucine-rich repeat protein SHOC-2-like n=1 Tax=Haliotis rufescens TaxID=6454 RepID=UPI00201EFEAD|nr:leucine-rich repeat protein SHOC-2-like [Haliotis rufescens]XP_046350553.2 leucine-rich repeat protein SHOC-2-like [Haliotis rufescens]XP_048256791.1 leucine-rich repeat protein SHOC-2-like [Haliotis rufescens]